MSNIYVPIDSSSLKSKIPIGEDILYSTMMRCEYQFAGTRTRFSTHVLMTKRGFYWAFLNLSRISISGNFSGLAV